MHKIWCSMQCIILLYLVFLKLNLMIKNFCFKRLGLKELEKFINFLYECYLMIVKFKEI